MAITKQKKETILAKLADIKQEAETIVFVNFKSVTGLEGTAMRAQLRGENVGYFVAKKTLIKRAFGDDFAGEMPTLDGEIALAYSTDPIAPAQHIKAFSEKRKDGIAIAGGVFQGVYKSREEMVEIASIPALPVLRGMFVNVINSPIQGMAIVLNAIAEKKQA
jgi:large subunit ribosomal protein L10